MMKRLSLLLAALFVGATLFAAPVIATGNGDNGNNDNPNNDNDRVCILHHHEDDNGKDYHWVWDVEDLHVGDKVVKDKYCDDHNGNGDHNGNHNGNHDGNHNGDHNGNDWS
jgi:hypothetical protein